MSAGKKKARATKAPLPTRDVAKKRRFDRIDRSILDLLQEDCERSVASIAEAVNLSQTPCWRRIKNMEECGLLRRRVALVDPLLANCATTVFIGVKAPRHEARWLAAFRELVDDVPEIVEAYRLTGQTDYLLKVVVPDIATYDIVYRQLIERLEFSEVSASIAMEELKSTTALPTGYL